jgi:hypothetical protein
MSTKYAIGYVAFNLDGTLLDVSLYTAPYQGSSYKDMVISKVDKFDWSGLTNQQVQNLETGTGTHWAGVSYSVVGVKKVIDLGYQVFLSEFGQ